MLPPLPRCRALAAELARRLRELLGWLFGRIDARRLRRWERAYFPLKRWHALAGGLVRRACGQKSLHSICLRAAAAQTLDAALGSSRLSLNLLARSLPPAAAAAVVAKVVQWAVRRWVEHASGARLRRKELQRRMGEAGGYEEWATAAVEVRSCGPVGSVSLRCRAVRVAHGSGTGSSFLTHPPAPPTR